MRLGRVAGLADPSDLLALRDVRARSHPARDRVLLEVGEPYVVGLAVGAPGLDDDGVAPAAVVGRVRRAVVLVVDDVAADAPHDAVHRGVEGGTVGGAAPGGEVVGVAEVAAVGVAPVVALDGVPLGPLRERREHEGHFGRSGTHSTQKDEENDCLQLSLHLSSPIVQKGRVWFLPLYIKQAAAHFLCWGC